MDIIKDTRIIQGTSTERDNFKLSDVSDNEIIIWEETDTDNTYRSVAGGSWTETKVDGYDQIILANTTQRGTTAERDAYFTDGGANTAGRTPQHGDTWANTDTTPPTNQMYNGAVASTAGNTDGWVLDPLLNDFLMGRSVEILSDVSATGDGSLYKAIGSRLSFEIVDTHDTSGAVSCTVTIYGTNESSVPTTDSNDYLARFTISGTDEVRASKTVEHKFANIYAVVDAIGSANEGITLTMGA